MAYDRYAVLPVWELHNFEEYPGFVMRVRKANFAGQLLVAEAMPVLRRASAPLDLYSLRALSKMCGALAGALKDWNLLNDGEPVPATKAGLMAQDIDFVMALAREWAAATSAPEPRPPREPEPVAPPEPEVDEEWLSQLPMQAMPPELVGVGADA